jgi:hypothetical protein
MTVEALILDPAIKVVPRDRGATFAKCLALTLLVTVILAPRTPAYGEDRMVLGPRQFEPDKTGGGAVLCSWSLYLSVQTYVKACGLARRPADDAMDAAIAAMDDFIIANSSLHPTRAMVEDFKRRAAESDLARAQQRGMQAFCQNSDIEIFRRPSPEQIQALVKALLAVPREPVLNPCP